jgi:hypothetical protein
MAKRLTDAHPLRAKFDALDAYMNEHKISIEFDGYHMRVKDMETGVEAYVMDNDGSGEHLSELPSFLEVQLILPE